ncbi:MAG: asparagine synthase-related protein, partial [Trebonia sp.]
MRVYLGLVARRPRTPIAPTLLKAARELLREAFPVPDDVITRDEWASADGSVALLGWSNEPASDLLPGILAGSPQRRSLGYCGYLTGQDDAARVLGWESLAGADELGGVFSLFRAADDRLEAATSLARVCPVYYAQAPEVLVAGSRALLVHLVAQEAADDPGVRIDVPALVPLVHHGFLTTDATPFSGVRALPAASVLVARAGGHFSVAQAE